MIIPLIAAKTLAEAGAILLICVGGMSIGMLGALTGALVIDRVKHGQWLWQRT